jgi:hypothetical protein
MCGDNGSTRSGKKPNKRFKKTAEFSVHTSFISYIIIIPPYDANGFDDHCLQSENKNVQSNWLVKRSNIVYRRIVSQAEAARGERLQLNSGHMCERKSCLRCHNSQLLWGYKSLPLVCPSAKRLYMNNCIWCGLHHHGSKIAKTQDALHNVAHCSRYLFSDSSGLAASNRILYLIQPEAPK